MHDWLLWWQQTEQIGLVPPFMNNNNNNNKNECHSNIIVDKLQGCMNMLDKRIWKSSIRLETKLCLYQTNASIRHTLCHFWCMGARYGPPQSTCSLALTHLTRGHYAVSWGYRILAMCQMRKSEEPLVVHRSFTWWLIDVCGSSAILLAVHLARTTIEPLHRVSDKYRPTGSDQQEDLATLDSV